MKAYKWFWAGSSAAFFFSWKEAFQTPAISYDTFVREILLYERGKVFSFAALEKLKKELQEELGEEDSHAVVHDDGHGHH